MTKDNAGTSSQNPADHIYTFLEGLPSPFRDQLLVRLYGFFEKEVDHYNEQGTTPPVVLLKLVGGIDDEDHDFQRAILLIGALNYLFSQETPWPPRITAELMQAAGMPAAKAEHPIRDQPYLEARKKWKKLRSKFRDSRLRKLDKKLSLSYELENKNPT